MRYNSQFEVNVRVSQKELDALEDILTCVPLCDKHKCADIDGDKIEHIAIDCPDCGVVRDKWFQLSWALYSKIGSAYEFCDKYD